jgi:hypothetical protein
MHVDPYYTKQNYTSKVELFLQQGIGVKVGKAFLPLYMEGIFRDSSNLPPPIVGTFLQCFGSGSVLDSDSTRSVDPDPDPRGQKLATKIEKNLETSCFEVLDVLC